MGCIKCSLISSFSANGIAAPQIKDYCAIDDIFKRATGCVDAVAPLELYMAMETDLRVFYRSRFGAIRDIDRPLLSNEVFSAMSASDLSELADYIIDRVRDNIGHRPIIGFATFIPEVQHDANTSGTASNDPEKVSRAGKALGGVLAIAANINARGRERGLSDGVRVVEIVCGSRFSVTLKDSHDRQRKHPELDVGIRSDEDAQDRLVKQLECAVAYASEVCNNLGTIPNIALELEPGPFFVLRDLNTLKSLCLKLEKNENLASRVGFNLDIAHWRIANILRTDVARWSNIVERIVHAHFSGHHPSAHFGDCVPTPAEWENLSQWIELLDSLMTVEHRALRQQLRRPQFSGFLSVEMESCQSLGQVTSVVRGVLERL